MAYRTLQVDLIINKQRSVSKETANTEIGRKRSVRECGAGKAPVGSSVSSISSFRTGLQERCE